MCLFKDVVVPELLKIEIGARERALHGIEIRGYDIINLSTRPGLVGSYNGGPRRSVCMASIRQRTLSATLPSRREACVGGAAWSTLLTAFSRRDKINVVSRLWKVGDVCLVLQGGRLPS